ncbi:MAG: hypothetical protein V3V04_01460 [Rhizobiaceae bacterium]
MFTKKIKSALIAVTIGLGAIATTGGAAQAEVRGGVYFSGSGIGIEIGSGHRSTHRRYGHRRHRYGHRYDRRNGWGRPDYRSNRCNPRKAVRKARRKGLRRAHIVRVNRRGVIVAGRRWGSRVVIGFDRSRRCNVKFVRSRHY